MRHSRKIVRGILWASSGQILSAILMMAMIKVWAVYLEPYDFGFMALIISIPSILLGVSLNPIFQSLLIHYSEHTQHGNADSFRTVARDIVWARVVKVVLAVLTIGFPISFVFEIHWVTPLLVACIFAVDALRVFEQRLLVAAHRQREAAVVSTGDILFRFIFVWTFLDLYRPSAYIAIVGNLLGASLFMSAMHILYKLSVSPNRQGSVSAKLRDSLAEKVLDFSKPLVPSAILANITEMGNRYIIGAILGLQETGLFVAAYGLVKRPYGMLNHVGEMVMSPVLREATTNGTTKDIAQARRRYIGLISAFSFMGIGLFIALRDMLVVILLSDRYAGISNLIPGLAISITLFNISNVFNWFSMTIGGSRAVLTNSLVGCGATIILTVIMCLYTGLAGAVGALFIGYSLQLVVSIFTFRNSNKVYQRDT